MIRGFIVALFIMFSAHSANAFDVCSCPDAKPTVEESLKRSISVFTGTVKEIKRNYNPDYIKYVFEVTDSWKGVNNKEISIKSDAVDAVSLIRQGVTCGYDFKKNQSYLVYSNRRKNMKGPAYASQCSRTKPIIEARQDLEELGNPVKSYERKKKKKPVHQRLIPTPLPEIIPLPKL